MGKGEIPARLHPPGSQSCISLNRAAGEDRHPGKTVRLHSLPYMYAASTVLVHTWAPWMATASPQELIRWIQIHTYFHTFIPSQAWPSITGCHQVGRVAAVKSNKNMPTLISPITRAVCARAQPGSAAQPDTAKSSCLSTTNLITGYRRWMGLILCHTGWLFCTYQTIAADWMLLEGEGGKITQ